MKNKLLVLSLIIFISTLVGMQTSVAAHYYLKPFLASYLALLSFFIFAYLLINKMWHNVRLIAISATASFLLFNLSYSYAIDAKDYNNREDIVLFNIIGETCPMKRGAKAVEVSGKDIDDQKHSFYTSKSKFSRIRGKHIQITYLPTSKKIIETKPYKKTN